MEDLDASQIGQLLAQDLHKAAVDFDGDDVARLFGQGTRQGAQAGAYLDDSIPRSKVSSRYDTPQGNWIDQEILPQLLAGV
jgi:hypothetical protein